MKPDNDPINWQVVHRTHEGNPEQDENPQRQYWNAQLRCINQKLHNLEFVSLTEPEYVDLYEKYQSEKQEIWQQLEKVS